MRKMNSPNRPAPAARAGEDRRASTQDPVAQNIEAVLAFYKREEEKLGHMQRSLEAASTFMGRPRFLACVVLFVALWIFANLWAPHLGWEPFDEPPFVWLQGLLCFVGLLTAIVVLIKQERLAKFEEQRAHLDLQVTLLTEQKASKIIDLLEELRRDLPNVKDRHDATSAVMREPADPEHVLAKIDERMDAEGVIEEQKKQEAEHD